MHSRLIRAAAVAALTIPMAVGLTACGSSTSTTAPATAPTAEVSETGQFAAIIDVRTPEEFSAGHVPGALNFDIQSPGFADQIASLDPGAGTYLVYCRSGNRSAVAVEQMRAAGLTVEDGGGLEDMQSAGWEIR